MTHMVTSSAPAMVKPAPGRRPWPIKSARLLQPLRLTESQVTTHKLAIFLVQSKRVLRAVYGTLKLNAAFASEFDPKHSLAQGNKSRCYCCRAMEPEMEAALIKVGMFVLVQALVYLILSQSSTVFSRTKSLALRPARSLSARRMLALLSDLPLVAGEPSPVAAFARTRSALSPMLAAAGRKQD
ncbi:uncharacterized protein [Zea mays]|uniref:Uncharacterized protein n=3 Tax=Zea mays TaxID=4577 RepID=A0A804MNT8_MAIZE|nr:uncharacterized protein LOC103647479 [Zea mays]|eukprot:XP_008670233.1 uncharacterized protein LOC103647479 [Zea mays]